MMASVNDALRVNPLGDANASLTATTQPIDEQPIKKAGEERHYKDDKNDAQAAPPCQVFQHFIDDFIDTHRCYFPPMLLPIG
jgi:hypothetical protein